MSRRHKILLIIAHTVAIISGLGLINKLINKNK